jgi:NADH-quinone oxidoreductase E subunit
MKQIKEETAFRDKDRGELLVQLKRMQDEFGYLSEASLAEVAEFLNVPLSEVYGVATFYSLLSTRPQGRNVIRICQSLPCYLKHAPMIIRSVEDELGIKPGETTPDGKFSFELTNCIGACDMAPAMLINHDVHGELTPEKIAQVLRSYK